ncbi:VCBS repeat-containing protein [Sorangium sp. So ce136]|uniref:FG-GAP repeat domain-containing protein n=1 Tax=Sorangium sp. So ce136 TaxID=3133284 RepID=UPI003F09FF34
MRTRKYSIALALTVALCGCDPWYGGGGGVSVSSASSGGGGGEGGVGGEGGSGGEGGGGEGGSGGEPATLHGVVQKGPLLVGSVVTVSAVDSRGNPTGYTLSSSTTSVVGDYEVTTSYQGYVSVTATGLYLDELTGDASSAPFTLHAFYNVARGGPQRVNVNLFTHLSHLRVKRLLGEGLPLEQATAQAEGELVAALGIGGPGFDPGAPGHSFQLFGDDTDGNAYLLAVNAVLLKSMCPSGDPYVCPEDQAFVLKCGRIAADLADDGRIAPELLAELRRAEQVMNADIIIARSENMMSELGTTVTAPDMARLIDHDGDGIPNRDDSCALVANPDQLPVDDAVCAVKMHYAFMRHSPGQNTEIDRVLAGDVTGDGIPDVLATVSGRGTLVFEGRGDGRLLDPERISMPPGAFPHELTDVNGDGYLDAVVHVTYPARFSGWMPGDGAGGFGEPVAFGALCASCTAGPPVIHDIDGDGTVDVVRAVSGPDASYRGQVSLGLGDGLFAEPIEVEIPGVNYAVAVTVADAVEDGAPDLLVTYLEDPWNTNTLGFMVVPGNGDGTFGPARAPIALVDYYAQESPVIASGDVDGDGHVDAISCDGDHTFVLFGDGAGNFGDAYELGHGYGCTTAVVADLNDDGKDDLVEGASAYVSRGRTLGPLQYFPDGHGGDSRRQAVSIADLDGDGDQDIVINGFTNNNIDREYRGYIEAILIGP